MSATDPRGSLGQPPVPSSALTDPRRLGVLAGIDFDNPELRRQLDAIVERTARRLDAPVGLVSLVSHVAQFFAGAYGLPPWMQEAQGTPVEWSVCTAVVASGREYTVADLAGHAVHSTNPLVTVDGLRSYAGVPLVVDGQVVGAHCVLGTAERSYTAAELEELRASAEEVMALLGRYRTDTEPSDD